MTEPERAQPPWLAYVVEHKEAVAMGVALLAVAVALAYAAETQRLRATLNGPAMAKMRHPCNCQESDVVIPVPGYAPGTWDDGKDYNANYVGKEGVNGNQGLRAPAAGTTADSGADAGSGDTA